ncbi:hypothetical protein HK101_000597 [Irineochytrium annulatum]|nr:hypothetical protein HK101_000597 [Irineochytrium annulatum]
MEKRELAEVLEHLLPAGSPAESYRIAMHDHREKLAALQRRHKRELDSLNSAFVKSVDAESGMQQRRHAAGMGPDPRLGVWAEDEFGPRVAAAVRRREHQIVAEAVRGAHGVPGPIRARGDGTAAVDEEAFRRVYEGRLSSAMIDVKDAMQRTEKEELDCERDVLKSRLWEDGSQGALDCVLAADEPLDFQRFTKLSYEEIEVAREIAYEELRRRQDAEEAKLRVRFLMDLRGPLGEAIGMTWRKRALRLIKDAPRPRWGLPLARDKEVRPFR